ncbi:MAG: hypothetical protein ACM3QU_11520 [Verrucomicrobiota bacterium]
MTEIADGIRRIESDLGPRFMCQYVVAIRFPEARVRPKYRARADGPETGG